MIAGGGACKVGLAIENMTLTIETLTSHRKACMTLPVVVRRTDALFA